MKYSGKKKSELEAMAKEMSVDDEAWENRELGASEEHVRVTKSTSIRLPKDMIASLKVIAGDKRLPYQTYLRMVLAEHIEAEKKRAQGK